MWSKRDAIGYYPLYSRHYGPVRLGSRIAHCSSILRITGLLGLGPGLLIAFQCRPLIFCPSSNSTEIKEKSQTTFISSPYLILGDEGKGRKPLQTKGLEHTWCNRTSPLEHKWHKKHAPWSTSHVKWHAPSSTSGVMEHTAWSISDEKEHAPWSARGVTEYAPWSTGEVKWW